MNFTVEELEEMARRARLAEKFEGQKIDLRDMLKEAQGFLQTVMPEDPDDIETMARIEAFSGRDTQNARLYSECRTLIDQLAEPGCVVLSFGWNSTGMGARWQREDTLIACHGGAHNDTICVADRLALKQQEML